MGILLAFAAGYVLGARAGSEDFDDVVEALQAIRQSEEFHDLVQQPALPRRAHAARAGLAARPGRAASGDGARRR